MVSKKELPSAAACMISLLAMAMRRPSQGASAPGVDRRSSREPQAAVPDQSARPGFRSEYGARRGESRDHRRRPAFIDSLNQIIRRQDYDAWLSNLTDEYIQHYSDPAILQQYSEYPIIKNKGIKLQTLKDYFLNVVFPLGRTIRSTI